MGLLRKIALNSLDPYLECMEAIRSGSHAQCLTRQCVLFLAVKTFIAVKRQKQQCVALRSISRRMPTIQSVPLEGMHSPGTKLNPKSVHRTRSPKFTCISG